MPQSVYGGRVDPVDAQFQGMPHAGDGFAVVLWSPTKGPTTSANGPRTETHSCDIEPARTQRTCWQTHDGASNLSMQEEAMDDLRANQCKRDRDNVPAYRNQAMHEFADCGRLGVSIHFRPDLGCFPANSVGLVLLCALC